MVTVEKVKYDKAILKKLYGGGPKLISITDEEAQELGLTEYVPNEITSASQPQDSTGESESQEFNIIGEWYGTIMGDYYYDRYGSIEIYYSSEIYFYQNGEFSNGGSGYQIDRNCDTNQYYRNNFTWTVRNARIYILYDDGYAVVIRDYEIYIVGNSKHFRGYLDDDYNSTNLATFDLVYFNR